MSDAADACLNTHMTGLHVNKAAIATVDAYSQSRITFIRLYNLFQVAIISTNGWCHDVAW